MARLIYTAIASVDGKVADADGNFDWAAPDEQLHAFVNDLERSVGTYLYGRRMYEVMAGWETMPTGADQPAVIRDYALIWRAADKLVYSASLFGRPEAVRSARTRIEHTFDVEEIRKLKADATSDLSIGGPTLAGHALRAGLIDECRLFLVPVTVGSGTPALPDHFLLRLRLMQLHRFDNGVVYLSYRIRY
ncbi:MAG TPA: dihydrofolate reductase family protein [Jatrophihabitans sp.]|nr:dihydrofolate reductase family protein [Jatrophihabitans sp.]